MLSYHQGLVGIWSLLRYYMKPTQADTHTKVIVGGASLSYTSDQLGCTKSPQIRSLGRVSIHLSAG
jgi:hypothetical protein